jgi:hypothetical protein
MGCERLHQKPPFATTMDVLLWNTKLFGYFVFGSNKPVHQNQMQLQ